MSWPSQFEVSPLDKPHKSSDSDGASVRLASPDAWACGEDSLSRGDASELEAWWRGLEIYQGVGSREVLRSESESSKF